MGREQLVSKLPQPRLGQRGFTLIELLVVVAIVAILAAVAGPSMTTIIAKNRVESKQDDLLSTLQYARAESISRARPITVCRSSDGASCGGTWTQGWIVFVDSDSDSVVDAGEDILRDGDGQTGIDLTVTDSGGSALTSVRFNALGASNSSATFKLCDSDDTQIYARAALLFASGRVLRSIADSSDNIHHDINGTDLACS